MTTASARPTGAENTSSGQASSEKNGGQASWHVDFLGQLVAQNKELSTRCSIENDLKNLGDASSFKAQVSSIIAYPVSTEEVQTLVKLAGKNDLPIVPRGARTGLVGGSTPLTHSLIIDMSQMNRVLHLDVQARTLLVEPGVTLGQIEDLLDDLGYYYPPDPASYRVASVGGTVATNAGGLRCVKYGVTAEWVQTLEVVLANGEILNLGHPVTKDVTGLNLKSMFIGSEGTLGIVTAVGLRVCPKPASTHVALAAFASVELAAATVHDIVQVVTPSMCELIDLGALKTRDTSAITPLLGHFSDWGEDPTLLMLAVDGSVASAAADLEALERVTEPNHARFHLVQPSELAGVFEMRRGSTPGQSSLRNIPFDAQVSPSGAGQVGAGPVGAGSVGAGQCGAQQRSALQDRSFHMIAQDISVPAARLLEMVQIVRRVASECGFNNRIVAHAGDGNLHVVFSKVVTEPISAEQNAAGDSATDRALESAMALAVRAALGLGGTVSGEHGIGALRLDWAHLDLGEPLVEAHRAIKRALDPAGIMNPGKAF